MNITDAIEDFISYCIFEKGLSDKTINSYRNDLNIYKDYLKDKGINTVNNIKSNHIKDFLKIRSNEKTTTLACIVILIEYFLYSFGK